MKTSILISTLSVVISSVANAQSLSCKLINVIDSETSKVISTGKIKDLGTPNALPIVMNVGKNLTLVVAVDMQANGYVGLLDVRQTISNQSVRFSTAAETKKLPLKMNVSVTATSDVNDDIESTDYKIECK